MGSIIECYDISECEIVKRIDGIYSNKNPNSNIRYVINESRFNASQLCKTKKGIKQMSDEWLLEDGGVNGDKQLVDEIRIALEKGRESFITSWQRRKSNDV